MARPLRDRLVFELTSVRNELLDCVTPILDFDLDYSPARGMKTYRVQLKEIGAMEAESSILLRTGRAPEWGEAEAHMTGETMSDLLESLARIRNETLAYLSDSDETSLRNPIPLPEAWWSSLGDRTLEAEELIRWISRHEYYHLGQIIAYRWIQGHNPYQ
jgi:uncharacterized damage-inducible protein DinB